LVLPVRLGSQLCCARRSYGGITTNALDSAAGMQDGCFLVGFKNPLRCITGSCTADQGRHGMVCVLDQDRPDVNGKGFSNAQPLGNA